MEPVVFEPLSTGIPPESLSYTPSPENFSSSVNSGLSRSSYGLSTETKTFSLFTKKTNAVITSLTYKIGAGVSSSFSLTVGNVGFIFYVNDTEQFRYSSRNLVYPDDNSVVWVDNGTIELNTPITESDRVRVDFFVNVVWASSTIALEIPGIGENSFVSISGIKQIY